MQPTCMNNLLAIAAAKKQWAEEKHKDTNDVPCWEDLRRYLTNFYGCPIHGIYTFGRVGEPPTCSMAMEGDSVHKLPTGELQGL